MGSRFVQKQPDAGRKQRGQTGRGTSNGGRVVIEHSLEKWLTLSRQPLDDQA
jgi:hypothetical protein